MGNKTDLQDQREVSVQDGQDIGEGHTLLLSCAAAPRATAAFRSPLALLPLA